MTSSPDGGTINRMDDYELMPDGFTPPQGMEAWYAKVDGRWMALPYSPDCSDCRVYGGPAECPTHGRVAV